MKKAKKEKVPAKKRALNMFNLENKLIYYVIRPFLNKHYDSQKRDRRIV